MSVPPEKPPNPIDKLRSQEEIVRAREYAKANGTDPIYYAMKYAAEGNIRLTTAYALAAKPDTALGVMLVRRAHLNRIEQLRSGSEFLTKAADSIQIDNSLRLIRLFDQYLDSL